MPTESPSMGRIIEQPPKPVEAPQKEAQDLKEIDKIKREKAAVDKELLQAKMELERSSKKEESVEDSDINKIRKELEEARREAEETKKALKERDEVVKVERFLSQNNDKYAFIGAEDAQDFVLKEMKKHKEETGEDISYEKAADKVESQLREINKKRISKLKGNKDFQELLGETPKNEPRKAVPHIPASRSMPSISSSSEKPSLADRDACVRYVLERIKTK